MASTTILTGEESTLTQDDIKVKSSLDESKIKKFGRNVNGLIREIDGYLGEMLWSPMDETTFQTQNGSGWVLVNGQDITGSLLEQTLGISTLPEARGTFLAGTTTQTELGEVRNNVMDKHTHKVKTGKWGRSVWPGIAWGWWANFGFPVISMSGGPEFRPKNVALYLYIRIN